MFHDESFDHPAAPSIDIETFRGRMRNRSIGHRIFGGMALISVIVITMIVLTRLFGCHIVAFGVAP